MINDVEAFGALGVIGAADVDQLVETERFQAQLGDHVRDLVARHGQGQFAEGQLGIEQHVTKSGARGIGQGLQLFDGHRVSYRRIPPVRRIFFWSCSSP